ncbi:Uncharacterized protein NEOC65_000963 [Neochlamydia sp. AcF65]|uniref:hypothetical protein n=1 Tax=Neochlamydia sp. AcF65 TaxID=2795735 RepID=UPI001BC99A20|nr:hypothetical protein [Neochlamydia sp. AcF65]MBS4165888.1 Uncharacterized protein [Neochlamydia sp. AcF65]
MVRISKQAERRSKSHRKPSPPAKKTGPRKENLKEGFKSHSNALEGMIAKQAFIPKIK